MDVKFEDQKEELLDTIDKLINDIGNKKTKDALAKATEYIVYRDDRKYSERLAETVEKILA